jgi:hypothetical protein
MSAPRADSEWPISSPRLCRGGRSGSRILPKEFPSQECRPVPGNLTLGGCRSPGSHYRRRQTPQDRISVRLRGSVLGGGDRPFEGPATAKPAQGRAPPPSGSNQINGQCASPCRLEPGGTGCMQGFHRKASGSAGGYLRDRLESSGYPHLPHLALYGIVQNPTTGMSPTRP